MRLPVRMAWSARRSLTPIPSRRAYRQPYESVRRFRSATIQEGNPPTPKGKTQQPNGDATSGSASVMRSFRSTRMTIATRSSSRRLSPRRADAPYRRPARRIARGKTLLQSLVDGPLGARTVGFALVLRLVRLLPAGAIRNRHLPTGSSGGCCAPPNRHLVTAFHSVKRRDGRRVLCDTWRTYPCDGVIQE